MNTLTFHYLTGDTAHKAACIFIKSQENLIISANKRCTSD